MHISRHATTAHTAPKPLHFRRWSRQGYAAFRSVGRCVVICHLTTAIADASLRKTGIGKGGSKESHPFPSGTAADGVDNSPTAPPDATHTLAMPFGACAAATTFVVNNAPATQCAAQPAAAYPQQRLSAHGGFPSITTAQKWEHSTTPMQPLQRDVAALAVSKFTFPKRHFFHTEAMHTHRHTWCGGYGRSFLIPYTYILC